MENTKKEKIDLTAWGLSEDISREASKYPNYQVGRVLCQEKGGYEIVFPLGRVNGVVSGKLRHEAATGGDYPCVGDFVMVEGGEDGRQAVICKVLPRKSAFVRKAAGKKYAEQVVAANIDVVFICMSLNNDFNLRRMERYIAATWGSGSRPVVLLTKADICEDIQGKISQIETVARDIDILTTSIDDPNTLEKLKNYIKPTTTVTMVGSSGVGKSSLINLLLGEERQETNGLRNDDKGRHTTTHREMFQIPSGGVIIDTPGMRELGMWDADEGIEMSFSDMEDLTCRCKFRNCTHVNEPGCAVIEAIEKGDLSEERWQSYIKLQSENRRATDAKDYMEKKKEKFKKIAKINKNNRKNY